MGTYVIDLVYLIIRYNVSNSGVGNCNIPWHSIQSINEQVGFMAIWKQWMITFFNWVQCIERCRFIYKYTTNKYQLISITFIFHRKFESIYFISIRSYFLKRGSYFVLIHPFSQAFVTFFRFCMINIGIVGRLCVICVQAINKLSLRYIFYDNVKLMLLMLFDEVNCWNVLFFASTFFISLEHRRHLIIFLPWRSTS